MTKDVVDDNDYYEWCFNGMDDGCCLVCEDAEPGCLCYQCKCKKCWWYIPIEEWDGEKGKCKKVIILQKRKEEKYENGFVDYTRINLNKNQKQLDLKEGENG